VLLSSAVGGDAFIMCPRSATWLHGYNNFASWIIVDVYSIMLMRLQELCKSCRESCYFILFWSKVAKFLEWRCQKLCVGADRSAAGAMVEAPAPSGVESGEGCYLPSRLVWGRPELPTVVQGEAPAADAFSAYSRPQNAFRRKNVIVMLYELLI